MNLESRLSKLEQQHSEARGYVIQKGESETNSEAIAAACVQPSEQDLVILLCRGLGGSGCAIDPAERLVSQFAVQS
jgi:hypothetical protein